MTIEPVGIEKAAWRLESARTCQLGDRRRHRRLSLLIPGRARKPILDECIALYSLVENGWADFASDKPTSQA